MIDQSEDIDEHLEKDFNFLADPGNIPSVDSMKQGVNVFNGDNWNQRPPLGAWEYTYQKKVRVSEPYNWLVPDQLLNSVAVTPDCVRDDGVT